MIHALPPHGRCWLLLVMLALPLPLAARPVVALLTDFGLANEAVGQCHGAVLKVDANIQVVDLCHSVDSYDIQLAALMLRGAQAFPKGTVFVAVVDPGVGTQRQAIALRTNAGYVYVGPNNGVLSLAAKDQGLAEAIVLDAHAVNPTWEPGTFDGRDLFSPAGALIASRGGKLDGLGSPLPPGKLIQLDMPVVKIDAGSHEISGVFLRTDEPYGNLWTNITRDDLTSAGLKLGDRLRVHLGSSHVDVPWVVSFGHVAAGQPLAYLNSSATLAFALNQGNFVQAHKLERGATIRVTKAPPAAAQN